MDAAAERRLEEYFEAIGQVLNNKRRRASYAMYAMGVLGDGERKSAEPIAARACGDPALANAYHQRLLEFLAASTWSDYQVRRLAARYAVDAMVAREPICSWIIDDTGFLKPGKHSVGVHRQYTARPARSPTARSG